MMALAGQQQMQATVAEATPLGGELPNAEPHGGVAGATGRIAHRRAINAHGLARPPLAHCMHGARMSHGLPSSSGRHHFRALMSFRMALSRTVSARSFFSFAFSSSNAFSRLASDTSRPPNFAFHL